MPDKHRNTDRWGGPGAGHEDPLQGQARSDREGPDDRDRFSRHSKVSGGGGEADVHHTHDPKRKGILRRTTLQKRKTLTRGRADETTQNCLDESRPYPASRHSRAERVLEAGDPACDREESAENAAASAPAAGGPTAGSAGGAVASEEATAAGGGPAGRTPSYSQPGGAPSRVTSAGDGAESLGGRRQSPMRRGGAPTPRPSPGPNLSLCGPELVPR